MLTYQRNQANSNYKFLHLFLKVNHFLKSVSFPHQLIVIEMHLDGLVDPFDYGNVQLTKHQQTVKVNKIPHQIISKLLIHA